MTNLYFDSVTLFADRLRIRDGLEKTFEDLGLAAGQTLNVFARELTVQGAPADRNINLAADMLIVSNSAAFHFAHTGPQKAPFPDVSIWAQNIAGSLSVVCAGRKGETGPKGAPGTPAVVSIDAEIKPPKRILEVPAGPGGRGGPGKQGGPGGTAFVSYMQASQTPQASAPGGQGGDGGPGGPGGDGNGFKNGPTGPVGPRGPAGAPGTATVRSHPDTITFWNKWKAGSQGDRAQEWANFRLRVAEYHYRLGTPEALATARIHLEVLLDRPGANRARVEHLLQQLREHVTFGGMPRDLDVTPDVAFVAQDNNDLYQAAQLVLSNAQSIAGTSEVKATFAQFMRATAQQGENNFQAAGLRVDEAKQGRTLAATATDVARGRVKNLEVRIGELKKAIEAAQAGPGTLGTVFQIVELGIAVGQVAIGVGTGVGAIADVARGFGQLQNAQEKAMSTFEIVKSIKDKLKDPSMKAFKTGLKDLQDAGKSIYHLGELISELDGIKSNHPDEKVRELAAAQRERLLLEREVGLNIQRETEAELGFKAAVGEQNAIRENINLSLGFAEQMEKTGKAETDPVLRALLTSVRQLLDALSIRAFRTLRAREIYLALDPTEVVRHDLGHLHPDREAMLKPTQLVKEITVPVSARALQIIQWSSLVDEMNSTGSFSRSPVPFWFISRDAAALAQFRDTGRFGFYVPIEDLFQENGSQIYEAKLDSVTVILHGAKIKQGSGQSIKLRQLGRWSVRRRDGIVKDFTLPPREIHLNCRQENGFVEAVLAPPANPRAEPPFSLWGRGVAGDWELADEGGIDMTGVTALEVGFMTQALAHTTVQARGDSRRELRPIPGWPPAPVQPRPRLPWSGWQPIGGQFPAGVNPAAVARKPGTLEVFCRSSDNAVWQNYFPYGNTDRWSGWFRIQHPGALSGDVALCSSGPNHIQLFGVGTDKQMYSQQWLDDKGWSGWQPIGGQFPAGVNPAAVARKPGTLEVFCRASDNAVWQNYFPYGNTGNWSGWFRIQHPGSLSGDVAICSSGPNHLQLFGVGTDKQRWTQYWLDEKGWSGWLPMGGKFEAGVNPAAVCRKPGSMEVFCRGVDNTTWQNSWPDPITGDWTGWFQIQHPGLLSGDLAICSSGPEHLQLFAVGTDLQMWRQFSG